MTTIKSEFGFYCEKLASEFLEKRGYLIIERNYRKPWGEIDIIAKLGRIMCFVEVKASRGIHPGFEPELRAGYKKMHKVARTAQMYMADKKFQPEQEFRFDLITVVFDSLNKTAKIKHFHNIDVIG
ncbi:MAG: hypothetical protein A3G02_02990 [Candidatus Yanofskybacteria bacterium RIFCSPLOWO2_12_FULL_44_13b]|uniref:UPF0102 protein A3I96_01360 n=2 Tax=Candidatus Yanofskyibacteriota TaxID=1752733 RepID=A0A1F8H2D3_9BACT|nr:MAG: hypothetical protein UW14_C0007G0032 [Candidatus Yanofskybacteria bacterium GW2011_GWA2_44_10]KKT90044.1 MAG: hypothetical protein UW90_C0008G0033 [Candidatus Yanofskybacteria bacterium GW2011_GWB1_45_11]OGN03794.1 MAG: hypothetical protein A2657_00130 [Candidatus Yanofskybacteria bacterium RIFCSPHIGHO2_01_FULL_44_110b]OGN14711.1 MAG: hypothetical protein A3C01_02100 [Candidatus Yanofskybacteria bacterium RIFCSPHIGHO2_02_FULL_44_36b]OGN18331.1 MAG: hypothetical protein A3F50_00300 [Cand